MPQRLLPCGFTPLQNPFYFALPYGEFDANGNVKPSAAEIPWYNGEDLSAPLSILKNHWIEVVHDGNTCFGQWEDVGPNGEDDLRTCSGPSDDRSNTFGAKAGARCVACALEVPWHDRQRHHLLAVRRRECCLSRPWKDIITSSGISWGN